MHGLWRALAFGRRRAEKKEKCVHCMRNASLSSRLEFSRARFPGGAITRARDARIRYRFSPRVEIGALKADIS